MEHQQSIPQPPSIATVKVQVDAALALFFDERIAQARAKSTSYEELWQALATLSSAGGKRFRPYVLLLAHHAYAPHTPIDSVLPAAVAQEVLHLAMLIHDDIIDRDDVRYGVQNITGQYKERYGKQLTDTFERTHYANSAALLAGDLLISHSYALLHQCNVAPQKIFQAQKVLSQAILDVIGGELIDTEFAFRNLQDVSAVTVAEQKTASYSFVGPLVMGAHLADASEKEIATLTAFGKALGIAYQLADDLLGVFGNEAATGKSVSGDIKEGKHTYLVEQFYEHATATQKQQFDLLFGRHDLTDEQVEQVRTLFVDSGAQAAVQSTIDTYAAEARSTVAALTIDPVSRSAFTTLIDRCTRRSK